MRGTPEAIELLRSMARRFMLLGLALPLAACFGGGGGGDTPTYTIGGMVTGLSGAGLVLQNNGGNNLAVGANGAFTFSSRVARGRNYSVTVLTQPSGPSQSCAVASGSGSVGSANVTSVSISCTTNSFTVGGTVTGLSGSGLTLQNNGGDALSVTADGAFAFATPMLDESSYDVTVLSHPGGPAQTCAVTNGTGSLAGANVTAVAVDCRSNNYFFLNGASADVVIGQPDFTDVTSRTSVDGFAFAYGNPALIGGKFYIGDDFNSRIMIFDGIPTSNGASAVSLIGQVDFDTLHADPTGPNRFGEILDIETDGVHMAAAAPDDNRVLIWNSIPMSDADGADIALGQSDLISNGASCAPDGMNYPSAGIFAGSKFIVTDEGNSRVLIWDQVPQASGQVPDLVLGQTDLFSCAGNDTNHDGTQDASPSETTFLAPAGAWSDGNRLAVIDAGNSRVLIWNTFPTTNAQPADLVLGQASFSIGAKNDTNGNGASNAAPSSQTLNVPYAGIDFSGSQLCVSDADNNRVLIWNAWPTRNFQTADQVLGQADFASQQMNRGGAASDVTLSRPNGCRFFDNDRLVIPDSFNRRALVYETDSATSLTRVLDLSNTNLGGGLGFGNATGEVKRYQTFSPGPFAKLDSIRVRIERRSGDDQDDVEVQLFDADPATHTPTGTALSTAKLDSTVIPLSADNPSENEVALTYNGLVDGNEYAIVLGVTAPAASGAHYGWLVGGALTNPGSTTGNYFGKIDENGVVTDESRWADAGLMLYLSN